MKIYYSLTVLTLLTFAAHGQNQSDSTNVNTSNKTSYILERLNIELNLSHNQYEQIGKILDARQDKLKGLDKLPEQARKNKIDNVNDLAKGQLKKILTSEQFDKYVSLRAFLKKERNKRGAPSKLDPTTDF